MRNKARHTAGVDHPYLDAPQPLAFAHRGGAAEGDENTAEAFERAVTLGYRYVETDVHATADGVPVVIHDPALDRVAGRTGRIADLTWTDLATVRVGGAAAVPRLDDVLDAWPDIRFNIDVKSDQVVEPTVQAVRRAKAEDRVLLASFSDRRLARVRVLAGPRVATSLGLGEVARLRIASMTGIPLPVPASAVAAQIPVRHGRITVLNPRFLAYLHRRGLAVHVWTIDDPEQMNTLLDMGVDGIMTDRIEVLRDVFAARGLRLR
ncbi:glycerophosphoryl diester phosphodiesterase [Actinoplanes lutulentus]|uniref:Glycerophosphoryl diester phosphodiesterase n=1 Tax=Actinoplanes lutulentus TaxID=1287878 RepID=A0A327ZCU3_9ACTN|nr:glycerophosphodiester phosphodiesterase [Actinoplanes lutulentus]RAK38141.1 glycerophosphoryl diester phosphodiesterase [Actinoplanes lutulentus]